MRAIILFAVAVALSGFAGVMTIVALFKAFGLSGLTVYALFCILAYLVAVLALADFIADTDKTYKDAS